MILEDIFRIFEGNITNKILPQRFSIHPGARQLVKSIQNTINLLPSVFANAKAFIASTQIGAEDTYGLMVMIEEENRIHLEGLEILRLTPQISY